MIFICDWKRFKPSPWIYIIPITASLIKPLASAIEIGPILRQLSFTSHDRFDPNGGASKHTRLGKGGGGAARPDKCRGPSPSRETGLPRRPQRLKCWTQFSQVQHCARSQILSVEEGQNARAGIPSRALSRNGFRNGRWHLRERNSVMYGRQVRSQCYHRERFNRVSSGRLSKLYSILHRNVEFVYDKYRGKRKFPTSSIIITYLVTDRHSCRLINSRAAN